MKSASGGGLYYRQVKSNDCGKFYPHPKYACAISTSPQGGGGVLQTTPTSNLP